MDQISASVETHYEDGGLTMVTAYNAECGCQWSVDMRGIVRAVRVCKKCLRVPYLWEDQLNLPLADA